MGHHHTGTDPPPRVLSGHTDIVHAGTFSPDGRLLASASADLTIRLWNTADPHTPRELATLTAHTDRIYAANFAPDGHTLATHGQDHLLRLLQTDTDQAAHRICATTSLQTSDEQWHRQFPELHPPC